MQEDHVEEVVDCFTLDKVGLDHLDIDLQSTRYVQVAEKTYFPRLQNTSNSYELCEAKPQLLQPTRQTTQMIFLQQNRLDRSTVLSQNQSILVDYFHETVRIQPCYQRVDQVSATIKVINIYTSSISL